MQADKTTINDLSIFHREEEQSIFHHLDLTTTIGGKEWLRHLLANPYSDLEKIQETQQLLQLILKKEQQWPSVVTNGTVMVVHKYYDSAIDDIPNNPNLVNGLYYKIVKSQDFSLIRFSVTHFIDFTIGLKNIVDCFDNENNPKLLQVMIDRIKFLTDKPEIKTMMHW